MSVGNYNECSSLTTPKLGRDGFETRDIRAIASVVMEQERGEGMRERGEEMREKGKG